MRSEKTLVGNRRGLTLTELMAVIGILVILLAILLPGLATIRGTGQQTTSESNLRSLFTFVKSYMTDNREFVPPSSFDYRESGYPGTVRTNSPRSSAPNSGPVQGGEFSLGESEHVGSWADIIWTYSDQKPILDVKGPAAIGASSYNYRYDSPDRWVFDSVPEFKTAFRSTALNTKAVEGTGATPFGSGTVAQEKGQPGYFAANDWFAIGPDSGRWVSGPQVRFPARSIYLVDSYAGETIAPTEEGWGNPDENFPTQVDFRYIGDNALFLTLDGGISVQGTFSDIEEVEDRKFRIHDLDKRVVEDHDHEEP
ncbi:MAG: prepilin-type N-terminal cleavage/methylation domain-containing protein [Phycisphaera sp.]|nr:prepilin-type N-terminal cleavage/methylation domain-containing protein [Phycisphaera sp.]